MPTYSEIADDVMVALGYDHDDSLRTKEAVLYNLQLAIDKLKKQHLSKDLNRGDVRGMSDMLCTFIVPVTLNDQPDESVTDWDNMYFDLPTSVYSLDNDAGISFVRYLANEIPFGCPPAMALTPFTGTTLGSVNTIHGSTYQNPKPSRPYYARGRVCISGANKDRVYLFGPPNDTRHLLVGLYSAPDFSTINPDDRVDLPAHLLHPLKQMLIDAERWVLQVPQERLKNDGRDFEPGQVVRTERQMSINNPIQLDE